ncbi:hypothetical protein ABVK25_011574 [Lepraria finkii]|uniref:Uncharacterized protein n=1 Tax=Lepraria finkii TaxID=1340010 RepID=A0ABR4AQ24_9LECA
MVAPFLPQLKKWISWQRKMDKNRQAGEATDVPITMDDEPQQPEISDANRNAANTPSDNEFGVLLNKFRQSAQPVNTSELPEAVNLSARLSSFLGVQPGQASFTVTQPAAKVPSTSGVFDNPKANGLLALLQPKSSAQPTQPPQTPMEQVIDHPSQPRSPPHPHHQPPRFSILPPPTQYHSAMAQPQQPQTPQTRPIPPPQQPAQLIPRSIHPVHGKVLPRANVNQQNIAPYQRTGDPEFAQYTQVPGNQPPSIPPASKLPPPKLSAQSATLLNIFKSGQPAMPQPHISDSKVSALPMARPMTAVPVIDSIPQAAPSNENAAPAPSQQKSRQSSNSAAMFIPPQVSPNMYLAKADEVAKPKPERNDKLLSLFRTPSKPGAEPVNLAVANLQLPSAPVELSALPATPGNSSEPSRKDLATKSPPPMLVQNRPVKIQKRPQQNTAKSPNPPVSATINGPLNVPQFDMLAKAAKEHKHAMHKNNQPQPPKRSPITILARLGSSHAAAAPAVPKPVTESTPPTKQEKDTAPKLQTFVTPVKAQPPTPNLKGQDVPAKPFHPQILRRPPQAQDLNEPSPIQPLPSPKHNSLADRRSTQPADHKKSLLSLFTKPSPVISPSSTVPASAIDPSIYPLDIISPLPPTPTPLEQAEAAFARLSKTVGPLSHKEEVIPNPSKPAGLRIDSINSALAEGPESSKDSGKQTPTYKKTTPIDKDAFLRRYLDGVR